MTNDRTMWGEQDSNLRRHKSADLQSAPVGRFGIPPCVYKERTFSDLPEKGIAKVNCFWIYPNFKLT